MNYVYYSIVGAAIIFNLIIFIFRKNKVGNILISVRTSKGKFMSEIIIGVIFLIIDGYTLYLQIIVNHRHMNVSNHSLMFIGIIAIINAIISKTYIGEKGVSFSTIPFYIPLNKISGYTIEEGKLVLNRFNMADYRIAINILDSNKIIQVMDELKITKEGN